MASPLPSPRPPAFIPLYWNPNWKLGDILHRLAQIAPDDVRAIEMIASEALKRRLAEHHEAMLRSWLEH